MKIKSSRSILFISSVILVVGVVIAACNKTNTPSTVAPGTNSIKSILQNATDATVLSSAIARVHLDTIFNGTGPFTLFAPTNDAFTAAGLTSSVLSAMPDDTLKNLILYHTIGANLTAASLPAGPNAKIISANGDSVFVTSNANGIFVNGVPLLSVDILASNGVIDAVSQVLFPPKGNILETIQIDTSFSYLVAAIARASQGSTRVDSLLSNGGPYTLFAPVNNGFRAAGFATTDDINNANADSIANIVLYHVLPSRIFSPDMIVGQPRVTLNDSSIVFQLSGSVRQVKGNQNTSAANALAINIMAHNGVLFVIDQMLLP